MIETIRQNMNISVLKRPNNYISHDRLNFKRSAPESLQTDETGLTSPCRIAAGVYGHLAMVLYSLVWLCVYATQQTRDVDLMLC